MLKQVGNCPECGAAVYAKGMAKGDTPPETVYSCKCVEAIEIKWVPSPSYPPWIPYVPNPYLQWPYGTYDDNTVCANQIEDTWTLT